MNSLTKDSLTKANTFLNSDSDDIHKDMYVLLQEYVKKDKIACDNLLYWISMIAKTEMAKHKAESQNRLQGIEQLIHIYGHKIAPEQFIPYTIHAVMQYFPRGNAEGASEAGREFFNRFVDALKSVRNQLVDKYWATDIAKCNDYLKLVLENNL